MFKLAPGKQKVPEFEAHLVPVITVPSGASQLLVSESPAVIVALKYK
jgi:hypothetical protein